MGESIRTGALCNGFSRANTFDTDILLTETANTNVLCK